MLVIGLIQLSNKISGNALFTVSFPKFHRFCKVEQSDYSSRESHTPSGLLGKLWSSLFHVKEKPFILWWWLPPPPPIRTQYTSRCLQTRGMSLSRMWLCETKVLTSFRTETWALIKGLIIIKICWVLLHCVFLGFASPFNILTALPPLFIFAIWW